MTLPIDNAELLRLYADGQSSTQVAQILGVSPGTVLYRLRKLGASVRAHGSVRAEQIRIAGVVAAHRDTLVKLADKLQTKRDSMIRAARIDTGPLAELNDFLIALREVTK